MSESASHARMVGRVLGDFVVQESIGEGGFGAVYRATQPLLDREAVIKVVRPSLRAGDAATQRFLREAQLASRLDHPYAAHVYAFGAEPDGTLWIAMELVRGTPLDHLLAAQGTIPLDRLVPLLERIAEVVHAAHEQGIVHRDLKPANVMVLSRSGRLLPKLLDFGIAKAGGLGGTSADAEVAVPDGAATALTQRGVVLGSPHYMAPEQWLDAAHVDARADLYALGVLVYEAMTGAVPFGGATLREIASAHANAAAPPLGSRFPPALDAVFAKVLAKAASDRHASAIEFAAAVREASGLHSEVPSLPQLPELVRDEAFAHAPQPIAEAVAAIEAARNTHQARDALFRLARVYCRLVGLLVLACHSRIGGAHTSDGIALLRQLYRRPLTDAEWLALARVIVSPYAAKRDAFPIPELVDIANATPLDELLALRVEAEDGDPRATLVHGLETMARALRGLEPLYGYLLVAPIGEQLGEVWMGVRRTPRSTIALPARGSAEGQPLLVARDGTPIVSLWPLFQVAPPTPGAAPELFLFDGQGRRGARLVSLPGGFERHDDALWDWLRSSLHESLEGHAEPREERSPYQGLRAFGPEDAARFVGRERAVDAFVNRLVVCSLLTVVGRSGAGKSSFVMAGVVPALADERLAVIMRPGASPVATLAARLAAHAGTPLLLVVDQLEELFTLCSDPDEHTRFAQQLVSLATTPDDRVKVVCTLRDDFLVRVEQLAPLRDRIVQGLHLLTVPHPDDLVRILVEPARRAGYEFEDDALPREMVAEVGDQPGALVLLSFTAARLWDARDRHFKQLGRKAYVQLGGVGGALAQHAEQTLEEMTAADRRLVREAFRHLVTSQGTRAVRSRDELRQILGASSSADAVIEALIRARLIVVSEGEDTDRIARIDRVEIVHEALFTAWPRLVEWRREDTVGARLREQLRQAARQWEDRGRPRGLLWRDDALAELRRWRARHTEPLTDEEDRFARVSLEAASRGRRRRRIGLAAAFAILGAVAIALILLNREARDQAEHAREQTTRAEQTIVDLYTEQGRQTLLDGFRKLALLHLTEAWRRGGREPALRFLIQRAGTALEQEAARFVGHQGFVRDARFSPDNRTIVTVSDDHTARLWETSGKPLHVLRGHRDWVRAAAFAPSGDVVVTVSWDGTARLWDVASGTVRWVFDLRAGKSLEGDPHSATQYLSLPCAADIAADGRVLAACVDKRAAIITSDGKLATWLEGRGGILDSASFSPDGARVLTTAFAESPTVYDARTGARLFELAGRGRGSASYDREGARILVVGRDGTARVSAADDGRSLAVLRGHQGRLGTGLFTTDGKRVVTFGYDDETVRSWDAASGNPLAVARPHQAQLTTVAANADGSRIFTADQAGVGVLTDDSGRRLGVFEDRDYMMWTARFSADGTRVLVANGNGTARLWRVAGDQIVRLDGHTGPVIGVRFSPAARILVTASEDTTIRVWNLDREPPRSQILARTDQPPFALALAADGSLVAVASIDGGVMVWEVATGRVVATLRGSPGGVHGIAFDPGARLLAAVGLDGKLVVWDVRSGARVVERVVHEGKAAHAIAFDDSGRTLATGSDDGAVVTWDVTTWSVISTVQHGASVGQLVFCGDRLLAAAGANIEISHAGRSSGRVAGTGEALVATRCPGERIVGTGGRTIQIADLDGGEVLERIVIPGNELLTADVAGDGTIAVGDLDGKVTLVRLELDERSPDEIAQIARAMLPLALGADGIARPKQ